MKNESLYQFWVLFWKIKQALFLQQDNASFYEQFVLKYSDGKFICFQLY